MDLPELDERKQTICDALRREIARQAVRDARKIDLVALAVAVDHALGGDGVMPGEPVNEGKAPDELNAANDV
ncbi:MAG TPA: hypothetical protein GYA10_03870 [Alphaproteobacteria bacterium]|nr:hypothetical protein [Alphaproteobacteria bacterium]